MDVECSGAWIAICPTSDRLTYYGLDTTGACTVIDAGTRMNVNSGNSPGCTRTAGRCGAGAMPAVCVQVIDGCPVP